MLKPRKRIKRREIKEDKFLTFVARATDFFTTYSRQIAMGIFGVLVVVVISYMVVKSKKEADVAASGRLIRAVAEFNNQNYDRAVPILQGIVEQFDGTRSAGIAAYYLAVSYYNQHNIEEAKKYFELYLDEYGGDPMLESAAYAGLASCYSETGDKKTAAEYYLKAAEKSPSASTAASYLFSAAQSFRETGEIQTAQEILNQILREYENTPVKADAQMVLAEISNRA